MDGFHPDMQAWAERIQEQRRQREMRQAAEASRRSEAEARRVNAAYDSRPAQTMGQLLSAKA